MRCDLNLKQLKTFYHVAKGLSFTHAAEELFISQPAVTMQISALEEQYGVPLFTRKKNEISLTEAGSALFEYAERVVKLGCEAERLLVTLKATPHGMLRIGTSNAFAKHLLAPHILKFRAVSPKVRIKVNEGNSEEMARSLLEGTNDLAMISRIPYDEKLEAMPFVHHPTEELVLVVPEGHRLAQRAEVTLKDIAEEPLILRNKTSGIRHRINEVFQKAGVAPTILLEASNIDFILDLVERGAGASILPRISLESESRPRALKAIPFAEGGWAIYVDVVVPREGYRPLALTSFVTSMTRLEPTTDGKTGLGNRRIEAAAD